MAQQEAKGSLGARDRPAWLPRRDCCPVALALTPTWRAPWRRAWPRAGETAGLSGTGPSSWRSEGKQGWQAALHCWREDTSRETVTQARGPRAPPALPGPSRRPGAAHRHSPLAGRMQCRGRSHVPRFLRLHLPPQGGRAHCHPGKEGGDSLLPNSAEVPAALPPAVTCRKGPAHRGLQRQRERQPRCPHASAPGRGPQAGTRTGCRPRGSASGGPASARCAHEL